MEFAIDCKMGVVECGLVTIRGLQKRLLRKRCYN